MSGQGKQSGALPPAEDRATHEQSPQAVSAVPVGIPSAAEFIEWTAKVCEQVSWQAGVGGMETAGAIVSYLAKHPEKLDAYMREGFFALPIGLHEQGLLSWHAMNGKIVTPEHCRRARTIKAMERGK